MTLPCLPTAVTAETWMPYATIASARDGSRQRIAEFRDALASVTLPPGVFIAVVGSLGRLEETSNSDVDFGVYATAQFDHDDAELVRVADECVELIRAKGLKLPNEAGPFGEPVYIERDSIELVGRTGETGDSNAALTHRMLLLCESAFIVGEESWRQTLKLIRSTYLDHHHRTDRPPRFLLNDITRYWRTMCVDFQGKMIERRSEEWGIRNAKLRMSRKLLFVGGVLPLYLTVGWAGHELDDALAKWYDVTPLERLVSACEHLDKHELIAPLLGAYNDFLMLLDVDRVKLGAVEKDARHDDPTWQRVKRIERQFQNALEDLFFRSSIRRDVETYALF